MIASRRRCGPLLAGLTAGGLLIGVYSTVGQYVAGASPDEAAAAAVLAARTVPEQRAPGAAAPGPRAPLTVPPPRPAPPQAQAAASPPAVQPPTARAPEPSARNQAAQATRPRPAPRTEQAEPPRARAVAGAEPGPTPRSTSEAAAERASGPAGEVVALTNAERADGGCDALRADSRLTAAAQGHAEDMAENGYFSHTSPDGSDFADRARAEGHPSPGGENIAQGQPDAEAVVEAWMNSSGHRRNILLCSFTSIGVGHVADGDYWVQVFGR